MMSRHFPLVALLVLALSVATCLAAVQENARVAKNGFAEAVLYVPLILI